MKSIRGVRRRISGFAHPFRLALVLAMLLSGCAGETGHAVENQRQGGGDTVDQPAAECLPQVQDGWVRLGPAQMPMAAGFAVIENGCQTPVRIVAASSPAFADVSLHETRIVDGVSRMRALPVLPLAPGASAVLEPGGKHLMLMHPYEPLQAGGRLVVEFELQDGRKLRGEFELRAPGG